MKQIVIAFVALLGFVILAVVSFYAFGLFKLEQQSNSPEAKCFQVESRKIEQARYRCEVDLRRDHPWARWSWVDNGKRNNALAAVCSDLGTHEVYFRVEENDCSLGGR